MHTTPPQLPARLSPRPIRALRRATIGHLLASAHAAFWPAVVSAGFVIGSYLHLTRGVYVDWSGWQQIPAAVTR